MYDFILKKYKTFLFFIPSFTLNTHIYIFLSRPILFCFNFNLYAISFIYFIVHRSLVSLCLVSANSVHIFEGLVFFFIFRFFFNSLACLFGFRFDSFDFVLSHTFTYWKLFLFVFCHLLGLCQSVAYFLPRIQSFSF